MRLLSRVLLVLALLLPSLGESARGDGHFLGNEWQRYMVQYFERARLEYHPESADPRYQVLLGQFGRQVCGERCR